MKSKHFLDERLWATSRWRWHLYQWWKANRLTLLLAVIVLVYGTTLYLDEREQRLKAQEDAYFMSAHLTAGSCFFNQRPSSLVIVGDSEDTLTMGLARAAGAADAERLAWKIAKEQRKH